MSLHSDRQQHSESEGCRWLSEDNEFTAEYEENLMLNSLRDDGEPASDQGIRTQSINDGTIEFHADSRRSNWNMIGIQKEPKQQK